jgi:hypothetical protein
LVKSKKVKEAEQTWKQLEKYVESCRKLEKADKGLKDLDNAGKA